MKITYILSVSLFLAVTAVGVVVGADKAAQRVSTTADGSDQGETKLMAKLNSPDTFSDSTLRRPF